jgi:uncharacterized membrane protein
MERIELVIKFMRNISAGLMTVGIALILLGVLVFLFPPLFRVMVSIAMVVVGSFFLYAAVKVGKYSKFKIDL